MLNPIVPMLPPAEPAAGADAFAVAGLGGLDAARWRSAFAHAGGDAPPPLARTLPEPAPDAPADALADWPPTAQRELPFECQLMNGPLAGAWLVLRIEPAAGSAGGMLPRLTLQVSPACVAAWRARGVDLAAALAAAGPVVLEVSAGDGA